MFCDFFMTFLFINVPSQSNKQKNLKVEDENSRIRIRIHWSEARIRNVNEEICGCRPTLYSWHSFIAFMTTFQLGRLLFLIFSSAYLCMNLGCPPDRPPDPLSPPPLPPAGSAGSPWDHRWDGGRKRPAHS
jgi:hypothetical protein